VIENVSLNTRVELLPFGVLRHTETVTLGRPTPEAEPGVEMQAGTTLVREIVAPQPARVIQR
jgi:hypothetical protein